MLKKILKSYDYSLIIVVVLLAIFGLVMVYSASMVTAIQRYGYESDHFFVRQKIFLIAGALVFIFFAFVPYKLYLNNKILGTIVLLSLISLIGIFKFGTVAGNAQSWYEFGPLRLQPSEFVKIAVIVYLSAVYAKKQPYINQFNQGVLPPLAFIVLVCALVALQPDFGTTAIIVMISGMIIVSSGMNFKTILKLALLGLILFSPFVFILKDEIFSMERLERFSVLTNPFADGVAEDGGYHLINSYYAIGSGGVNGLGLGQSVQKLGYLPEPHTDFIMAIIAEELGVFGVAFVILSLAFIVLKGIFIALKGKDPFGSLLAIGISGMIGIQTFINLAGISGIFPLMGIPLPFVSYGGSSLLQLSIAMGILVNVSMFVNYEKKYKTNEKEGLKVVSNNTRNSFKA
ncbi:FtsW/RodA/SpoVE family cell cycle protein [Robertmurraya kyonggiensis]|uniref:Probable peptidoglycan glycosyltransferase FtsW n=1 Tax=Robertmurraya kyonggiensis TaxID=1037680 RepID=A0A4U1D7F3_9BACI|nr:FtsW/RodA/SpoVE family cell cycle protein [Robertmurraya kyonggiensis]TKC18525.1 FtsW/RodA/SpoVE family cell cycle protein [Robertmurraya kyonggiensis]